MTESDREFVAEINRKLQSLGETQYTEDCAIAFELVQIIERQEKALERCKEIKIALADVNKILGMCSPGNESAMIDVLVKEIEAALNHSGESNDRE